MPADPARRRLSGVVIAAVVAASCFSLLAFAPSAWAWRQSHTRGGEPLSWHDRSCVHWTLAEQDLDNSHFREAAQSLIPFAELQRVVLASFDTWAEVDCSYIRFVEDEPTHCIDVGVHDGSGNANRIFFRREGWLDVDAPWRSEGQIALTSVFYDVDDGALLDVDIEFNAEYFEISTNDDDVRTDLQNALTHELGHFVGLDHSDVHDSTMYASADDRETEKRDLHADDIEGVCSIYPMADDPGRCPEPYGGLDVECDEAVWCEEPAEDGIIWLCTFDEMVCCCSDPGGVGTCEWEDATECHHMGYHVQEISDVCGDRPGGGGGCSATTAPARGLATAWLRLLVY